MSCQVCGHEREGDVQPHNYGCARALSAQRLREHARNLVEPDFTGSLCAKDGCSEPRAASKGPRPAKYCDEHKTVRSK
jgi:hypothetical protein